MDGPQIAYKMKAVVDETKANPTFFYLFALTLERSPAP